MTSRTVCLATLSVTCALVLSSPALAQELNCDDFPSQEAAQEALREDPTDPEGLDGPPGAAFSGIQGVACEDNPPPTDFDPALPSGFGVPNEVSPDEESLDDESPDRERPDEDPPNRERANREPPAGGRTLMEAGGNLPLPEQPNTDNASSDDGRFPLWRVVGIILSAGGFVFAGYRVFSRG
jgi:hypothetical protein